MRQIEDVLLRCSLVDVCFEHMVAGVDVNIVVDPIVGNVLVLA